MSNSIDPDEAYERYSWAMSCEPDFHGTFEEWKIARGKEKREELELAQQMRLSHQKMARGHCDWEKEQNPLARRQLFAHQANLERTCFPRYRCHYAVDLERGKRITSRYPYPSWTQRHPYTPSDVSSRSGGREEVDKGVELKAVSRCEDFVGTKDSGPVKRLLDHESGQKSFSFPSFPQQVRITNNGIKPEPCLETFKDTSKFSAADTDNQSMTEVKSFQELNGARTKWRRLRRAKRYTKRALLYLLKLTRFAWSQKKKVG